MSRRPSLFEPSRSIGKFSLSDEHRVLFPGLTPAGVRSARYYVTPLGRVYRDDGRLLRPHERTLKVKLNGGRVYRSVPAAVFAAFGNVNRSKPYIAWVPEDAPIDELTGRRSCDIRELKLVKRGELIKLARGTLEREQLKFYKAFNPARIKHG